MKTKQMKTRKIWLAAITIILFLALGACVNPADTDLNHSHEYSNWKVVTLPSGTEKKPGAEARICSVCAAPESRLLYTGNFTVTDIKGWEKAIADIKAGDDNGYYMITIDGTIAGLKPTTTVPTFGTKKGITVLIKGSGTLSLSTGVGNMFLLGSNGNKQTLVIDGEELILKGRNQTGSSSIINVGNGGELLLNNGLLTGNTGSVSGGAVYVNTKGTFVMEGGKISNNSATNGGGVFVGTGASGMGSGGRFIMSNGEISNNTAISYGGGMRIEQNGGFVMRSGKISGNSAAYGGAMYLYRGFSLMTGGEISGNKATASSGGVYTYGSASTLFFLMNNGTVYGNEVSSTLANTGAYAALRRDGTTQYGTLNRDLDKILSDWEKQGKVNTADWKSNGTLPSSTSTIKVVNGVKR